MQAECGGRRLAATRGGSPGPRAPDIPIKSAWPSYQKFSEAGGSGDRVTVGDANLWKISYKDSHRRNTQTGVTGVTTVTRPLSACIAGVPLSLARWSVNFLDQCERASNADSLPPPALIRSVRLATKVAQLAAQPVASGRCLAMLAAPRFILGA